MSQMMTWMRRGALLALTGACAMAALRADEPAKERQTLTIPRVATPIVVDGALQEWPAVATRATIALDPDADEFRGTARLTWDAQNLYVAFEVASGKMMRNSGDDPATAFKTGDTVEVFLSVNADPLAKRVSRGPNLDNAKDGDYKILMTLLRDTKPTVFGYDFVHPGATGQPLMLKMVGPATLIDVPGLVPGATMVAKAAVINEVPGFIVEAKLPWAYFRTYQPAAGARLLFNLAINFSNSAGTANMGKAYWNGPSHMVQDLGVEAQIHPEHWGWLQLAEQR